MGHSIDHYPEFHILQRSKNQILVLDHDNFTRNIHLYRRPRSLTVKLSDAIRAFLAVCGQFRPVTVKYMGQILHFYPGIKAAIYIIQVKSIPIVSCFWSIIILIFCSQLSSVYRGDIYLTLGHLHNKYYPFIESDRRHFLDKIDSKG